MSAQSVETILSRAMSDSAFADQLFANADAALASYELTSEERTSLKSMSRAELDKFAAAGPEERRSFSIAFHSGTLFHESTHPSSP